MGFIFVFQTTFEGIYDLFMQPLNFPHPIGSMSPFQIMAFFTVAYVAADFVRIVASRRDSD